MNVKVIHSPISSGCSPQATINMVDIDLANKPAWLPKFSPHGKVPVGSRCCPNALEEYYTVDACRLLHTTRVSARQLSRGCKRQLQETLARNVPTTLLVSSCRKKIAWLLLTKAGARYRSFLDLEKNKDKHLQSVKDMVSWTTNQKEALAFLPLVALCRWPAASAVRIACASSVGGRLLF
eukprot:1049641-Pelagomonas_calceolata.AAC.2